MANEKRLIELGNALRMIQNSKDDCPETSIKGRAIWETAHNCSLSCLTNCDTVDAVEVVHGRWNSVSLDPQDPYFNCTNCGIGYSTIYHECEEMKYCPNCGAKMDGGNKHDGQKEKV